MRTMTVRDVGCLSTRDAVAGCPFDFGKQLRRFQDYIETSDWDERLIRCVARFDKAFFTSVIFLAVAFFLSWSRTF